MKLFSKRSSKESPIALCTELNLLSFEGVVVSLPIETVALSLCSLCLIARKSSHSAFRLFICNWAWLSVVIIHEILVPLGTETGCGFKVTLAECVEYSRFTVF